DTFHHLNDPDRRTGIPSATNTGFKYLKTVPGISTMGGTQRRNCTVTANRVIPCWYMDPARAQGATRWRHTPNDGQARVAPAPLSYPFYVYGQNTRAYRVWLSEDTGYSRDIAASRALG